MVRRTSRVAVAVVTMVGLLTPSGVLAAGRAFPEGSWAGDLVFAASGYGETAAGNGTFEVDSDGTALDGTIEWTAVTSRGTARVEANISGPPTDPMITDGFISTSAGTFPMDIPAPMPIRWATCEQVAGYGIGVNGVTVNADWLAWRLDSVTDLPDFRIEVDGLIEDLQGLELLIASGETPDTEMLVTLATRAVDLASSVSRSDACSPFSTEHSAIGAAIVARILEAALADPTFPLDVLADLATVALETGAIGSGAGDPSAAELEADLIDELQRRIDEAVAGGDYETLIELGALTQALGYRSLEDQVLTALVDR